MIAGRSILAAAISIVGCTAGDDRGSTSFATGVSVGTTITTDAGSSTSSAGSESSGAGSTSSGTTEVGATSSSGAVDTSGAPGTTDTGAGGCPAPGGQDCSPGDGSGKDCADVGACFIAIVQDAVQSVIAAHPEWFDAADPTLVLDAESYMNAVVDEVNGQGVCAIRDPNAGDEMGVKHDNAFAESYDILSADGHARYGELIYTATCTPAWF